jgi:SAM-dependent methyltransferase
LQAYDSFAAAYDAAGFGRFADETAHRLAAVWRDELPGDARILDLAGGTGRAAARFRRAGFSAVTVDLSHGMLRAAKGPRVQADARRLPFRAAFGAVVLFYDAVNHLAPADLRALFGACAGVLVPGGRLAFDANTAAAMKMWIDEPCEIRTREAVLQIASRYDAKRRRLENTVTGWAAVAGGRQAVHDRVVEWYHPARDLERAFTAAGFEVLSEESVYMDQTKPKTASKRLYELVLP